jgi:hypothetical protein
MVITMVNLLSYRIPNVMTYPGVCAGLVLCLLSPGADALSVFLATAITAIVLFAFTLSSSGGLGLGTVKLGAFIATLLGTSVVYVLFISWPMFVLIGLLAKKRQLPTAPFLALAAIVVMLIQGAAFAPP